MTDSKFDDNDPAAYSTHILYITHNDPHSDEVRARLGRLALGEKVFVQDARAMTSRPHWLVGVPTLYEKETQTVISGMRDIVAYASAWKDTAFVSNTSSLATSGTKNALDYGSFDDSMFSIEGDPTTVPTAPQGGGGGPQMGERARRKAEMAANTNNAVEQMQNARAAMDRRMTMQGGGGHAAPPRRMMMEQPETLVPHQQRRHW